MFQEATFVRLVDKFEKTYKRMTAEFERADGDFDAIQQVRKKYVKRLRRQLNAIEFIRLDGKYGEGKFYFECAVRVLIEAIQAYEPERQKELIDKYTDLMQQATEKMEEVKKGGKSI